MDPRETIMGRMMSREAAETLAAEYEMTVPDVLDAIAEKKRELVFAEDLKAMLDEILAEIPDFD